MFIEFIIQRRRGIDLSISLLGVERLTNLYNRKPILSVSQVHGFLPRSCLGEKGNTYETNRILIADVNRLL